VIASIHSRIRLISFSTLRDSDIDLVRAFSTFLELVPLRRPSSPFRDFRICSIRWLSSSIFFHLQRASAQPISTIPDLLQRILTFPIRPIRGFTCFVRIVLSSSYLG
jgi:hypothetical protein